MRVTVDINEIRAIIFSITDEHIHDSIEALNLVNRIRDKISKPYRGKAIIPLRKNYSTLSKGSPYRARIAREIRRTSEIKWKNNNNYGRRWIVEIYFSGLNSIMGEMIKAKRHQYIAQEISM